MLYEMESYHLKEAQETDKLTLTRAYAMYEDIIHSDLKVVQTSEALASLMTRMEHDFGIPELHDPEWERDNRAVISLYRIISESRQF